MKKTALVTGASRGLGAACAAELGRAGMRVGVNYFRNATAAEDVCARVRAAGGQAVALQGDVRVEADVSHIVEALGQVEVLVVNATGPQPMLSIEEQTWEAHVDQLEYFVKSPLLLLKAVLAGMKARRWGRVVMIGSEVVELGNARFGNYVGAKAAQLGLTRSWATELAPWGITVNLVAPGWIPTGRHEGVAPADMERYIAGVPMGKMGVPEDVGRMVAWLAGEGAGFVTGQKFAVNGGNTLE